MTKPATVTSTDGVKIAYETQGAGPTLILVGGAFNDRHAPAAGAPLGALLADAFTVIAYDRRGRGDSGDGAPYAVEREIEDLRALASLSPRPPFLFGHSSGGALALQAVLDGMPVAGLGLFETPYTRDAAGEAHSLAMAAEIERLLADGRAGDAAAHFLTAIGVPEPAVAGMRHAPMWPGMERLAPTLDYDMAVTRRGGTSRPPLERMAGLDAPLLSLAGGDSPEWMRQVARALADAAPNGTYQELPGQGHAAPAGAIAPALRAAFSA